nr:MAG TPA: hypothetical protein [Caudoviricetes sp.]
MKCCAKSCGSEMVNGFDMVATSFLLCCVVL